MNQPRIKLFLDDVRKPKDIYSEDNGHWLLCSSVKELKFQLGSIISDLINTDGEAYGNYHSCPPIWISFDHDLGENEETGYDLAKWLEERHYSEVQPHLNIIYSIHSANPVGRKNIQQALKMYTEIQL